MKSGHKKILWIIGIVLISCITGFILFFGSFIWSAQSSEEDKLKFDKVSWVNFKTKDDDNIRHYMLTDLKNNYLKKGMDSTKVIKLLGEPERQFGFSYNLGIYDSPFDPSFLIIEFNKKGKLVKFSVQTI
ncbi:hypothetical protein [Mucilaginibacter sp.]|uniref:hypothetical protein n=1 Tax=Mucilaginibacter sp. TaxID=1882438 RepID=UPI002606AF2A|nr:hypothetical protein [Mucilaginibacter sp.]